MTPIHHHAALPAYPQDDEYRRRPLMRNIRVLVEDPDLGMVPVRWYGDRLDVQPWRCRDCGDQDTASCIHTFSAAVTLAEKVFGLTRLPEFQPYERTTP